MRKKYRKSPSLSTELKGPPHSMPGEALSISPSVKSSVMVKQRTSPSLIHSNNLHYGKCEKMVEVILGAQQEYLVYEGVSMSDYNYVVGRLEESGYRKTWNRLTYFPISERLMVSSPSALHDSILGALMGRLGAILSTIPVPSDTVIYRTMQARSVSVGSVRAVPDSTVMMCTRGGRVADPIWLMECAFTQSDRDVMQKLNSYVQEIPSLLVVGKLVIKQGQRYRSPGSKASAAPQLRSSELMTQRQWADRLGDEFEQVISDGHTWLSLSSVEFHVWTRQAGNSKIELSDTDGDGYALGTLYPTVNLDDINHAFQRGLELIKQEVLMVLESVNADRALFDCAAAWSPPSPVESASLRSALEYGACATAYERYADWRSNLKKKPYNTTAGHSRKSRRLASKPPTFAPL
ncbi:hypothetical protein EDC04DRAFT_2897734 [Pisolithus marmoratus]|nr:hypothetical protein EDC04DRAFT_2897734 [Pisolithus marmoratus]